MGMRLRSAARVFESSSARVRHSLERASITARKPKSKNIPMRTRRAIFPKRDKR
jgi:hypothetical protein